MSLLSTGYLMYPDVLDGWSSETSKPTSIQPMRSTRVVSRQRKLDDFIKSELQRLNSRLDATDVRIQRLIGGEVPTNPKQFLDTWPEYKIHGHSGDQRFCCISLHFNLCGIQSHFHGSTPSARSTLRSPLAVYSNLRSLESFFFRPVCLIQFQPQVAKIIQQFHQIPCHPCCHAACARTSTPRLRSQRTALHPPRAPPRPRRGGHPVRLRRRRKPRRCWAGAARHRHCRLELPVFGRFLVSNGWRWHIDGTIGLWIVVDCNASIFNVFLWKCLDDKMSWFHVVDIEPNDALASSPSLHAFKFS